MATTPYFVLSPNTLVSIVGLIHGPDKTVPTPTEDWRQAKVDVIIPALNEERNIVFCLDSLTRQTLKPRNVILVDDGSHDRTVEFARSFCETNGLPITIIQRKEPIGKTPTLKRQSREFDSDVEFILDSDTILVSPDYIQRTVEELYKAVGIASACGNVLSFRKRDRKDLLKDPAMSAFMEKHPEAPLFHDTGWFRNLQASLTSLYRESLYVFLQRFVYRGQMTFFGTITHPVGCAVAYRRKYIKDLFDRYEPILGDDLTNSEDIFIGIALINQGYRNIQLPDVLCRSQEPDPKHLPHQFYMWSSSFLQSCFYFNDLTATPFKAFRRWRHNWKARHSAAGKAIQEMRKVQEPYREAFGDQVTKDIGRPIGWSIFMSALEKIMFPTAILIMMVLQLWEELLVTILVEVVISLGILAKVAPKGSRIKFILIGILITPIRYSALIFDLWTTLRFAADLWIRNNRKWRK